MIIGIGQDLCDARRLAAVLERHGSRFAQRCFTAQEQARAAAATDPAATFAKRFAAKEACAKALGTGIDGGVFLRDIGVVNDARGRPALALTGGAAARLAALTPPGHRPVLHLSLTDEKPFALAFVVIEARPAGDPAPP